MGEQDWTGLDSSTDSSTTSMPEENGALSVKF